MARVSQAREQLLKAAIELIWESSYGSTSVDAICERADVRKGSFYHFFESKSALAVAALEAEWERHRPEWDRMFSPLVPPLERFERIHMATVEEQTKHFDEKGFVIGCPLFSLGCELGTQNEPIRRKVQEILAQHLVYLESAIRDAHAQGVAPAGNARTKAQIVLSYVEGQMSRARIENSLEPIHAIQDGVFEILGVIHPAAV